MNHYPQNLRAAVVAILNDHNVGYCSYHGTIVVSARYVFVNDQLTDLGRALLRAGATWAHENGEITITAA